ncbi:MAG: formylglycine-generating enzyme family protein [Polyangiaceae bacterium]|nr:formylglycine-generating enzyme family protein [Polyangiaceae bacterium]
MVARSEKGKMPLTGVTLAQAEVACKNAGKRLCKHDEWAAACRGVPKQEHHDFYCYGDQYQETRCWDWKASDGGKKKATLTGSKADCVSATGAYDLTGNVGELTSGPDIRERRVVRGGTYNMTLHDSACDSKGYLVTQDTTGPDIGFRCCADAK